MLDRILTLGLTPPELGPGRIEWSSIRNLCPAFVCSSRYLFQVVLSAEGAVRCLYRWRPPTGPDSELVSDVKVLSVDPQDSEPGRNLLLLFF